MIGAYLRRGYPFCLVIFEGASRQNPSYPCDGYGRRRSLTLVYSTTKERRFASRYGASARAKPRHTGDRDRHVLPPPSEPAVTPAHLRKGGGGPSFTVMMLVTSNPVPVCSVVVAVGGSSVTASSQVVGINGGVGPGARRSRKS